MHSRAHRTRRSEGRGKDRGCGNKDKASGGQHSGVTHADQLDRLANCGVAHVSHCDEVSE